uniref:MAGUK p55 subfamily member 3 n=1 Tax=Podarcis muralis TaxID=64176 RepID=UPI0010A0A94E|nr:MAGUK p55 subfamily member 3 [Podarcis muralis]
MPVLSEDSGLHETLALLTSQLRPDSNHKEEMVFLRDIFSERSLSYLMKIHEKLCHYERQSPVPVLHSASALAEDVIEELQTTPMNNDEKELLQLLSTPHLRAMLAVHDTVAQKNFDPVLPPLPDNIDEDFDEESVKIVRLVKNKEPLGATIRRDEHTGAVIVARIMRGGAADRSGLVHVGDELREVNGVAVLHKRPEEISQILAQSQGSITLKIIPAVKEEDRLKESKVFMRALFSYNPKEDKAIPCQEAGLPFQKRHILEVVSQDDPTWWQAKRVGDTNLRAGLIPSKQFQERRLMYRRTIGALHNARSVAKPLCESPRNLSLVCLVWLVFPLHLAFLSFFPNRASFVRLCSAVLERCRDTGSLKNGCVCHSGAVPGVDNAEIIPAVKEEDRLKESKVFMRALFSYNPKEDKAIPCQEAGLPFQKRHILEVVSQDDPTWWQAKRVGDTNLRAGLIPSKQFQERRLMYRRTIGALHNARSVAKPLYDQSSEKEDCDCEGYFNGQYIAGLRRSFRLSRKEKQNGQSEAKQVEQPHPSELLTYEEVVKYQQQPGERKRLVVLIGSLGSRLNELKQKVVAENPQEYGVAVPRE